MQLDENMLYYIITGIFMITTALLGVRWQLAKMKLHQVRKLVDDVAVAVDHVDIALADNTIDDKEYKEIVDNLVTIAADLKEVVGQDDLNLWLNRLRENTGS